MDIPSYIIDAAHEPRRAAEIIREHRISEALDKLSALLLEHYSAPAVEIAQASAWARVGRDER